MISISCPLRKFRMLIIRSCWMSFLVFCGDLRLDSEAPAHFAHGRQDTLAGTLCALQFQAPFRSDFPDVTGAQTSKGALRRGGLRQLLRGATRQNCASPTTADGGWESSWQLLDRNV